MTDIRERIEEIFAADSKLAPPGFDRLFERFMEELNAGRIRAAEPSVEGWRVNAWVKKGILLGFRFGSLADYSINDAFCYFDKTTFPLRPGSLSEGVRIVPGGTSVRSGCYLAEGVVIMPPAYVNVGAYVGPGTMIDSHALVGSCAQIGAGVHLSAAAQIGGVLEPIGAVPVVIEDDVLVGGNCGIYEGTVVKKGAVIGAGTVLTASIPVYDVPNQRILRRSEDGPMIIPENAVVVPGSRPLKSAAFPSEVGLHVGCAVIVKYRDQRTNAATALESALR